MIKSIVTGFVLLSATSALADPIASKDAAKLLFAPQGAQAVINKDAGLKPAESKALATVLAGQPYYAAAAFSPGDGLMSEATQLAGNYNDVDNASAVALAQCNKVKKAKQPCVIVATSYPKGWKARPLQLSSDATAGFKSLYPAGSGAMATSAATGAWAIKGTAVEAIAACKASEKKPKDCVVVIQN
ncbi:MAG: 5-aminolevulic acid synthase [bacterium]